MNLEHAFSTLLLVISYKGVMLGTSPINVFNPMNETYTFVQSE